MNKKIKTLNFGYFRNNHKILNKLKDKDSNIIFIGKSGTGKTFLTRYFHKISSRKNFPLIEVNLSAIPDELFESTLFGHSKGSFTGAIESTKGLIDSANGGILVFENLESIPLPFQAKLLKFLENKEFSPIGTNEKRRVDILIITHFQKDPLTLIKNGLIREDIFYRLNGIQIYLKELDKWENLNEKINFIKSLIDEIGFIEHRKLTFSHKVLNEIASLSFKGNIRELELFLRKFFILLPKQRKKVTEIPEEFMYERKKLSLKSLKEIEKEHIIKILNFTNGNKTKASKILGISRKGLIEKCKRYGINTK